MTAPDSKLLEPVARAICRASGADPDKPIYRNANPDSGVLYYTWKLYREEARAAIAACEVEALRTLLESLIGETGFVIPIKEWEERDLFDEARALLARLDGKPMEEPA